MTSFSGLAALFARMRRMRQYQSIRREVEAIPDADLADMGLKRYQLGHVARARFLPTDIIK
jgi:uncharacterized protein YjiS (DUF1127 family)